MQLQLSVRPSGRYFQLGEFVKTLKNVLKFEILPYHTMGEFKWRELGWKYPLEGVKPPTKDRVHNAKEIMNIHELWKQFAEEQQPIVAELLHWLVNKDLFYNEKPRWDTASRWD